MPNDEYIYEVISNESDAYTCARLIAEEFCAHNPITLFDRVTTECFFEHVSWPLMKDMFEEGWSFLARHRSSGEIVGGVVAGDMFTHHQKHPSPASHAPQAIAVNDLLDEMDQLFIARDFGQELQPNLVLHITVAAVRAQHSGKGVMSQLNAAMCDHARQQGGFRYAMVQVTNDATRHVYIKKMKGVEVTTVDPTTWVWKQNGDGTARPYQDYHGGTIPNILITLRA